MRERPAPRRHGRGAAAEPAPVRTGRGTGGDWGGRGSGGRLLGPAGHGGTGEARGAPGEPRLSCPALPGGAGSLPGSGGAGQVAVRAAMGFVIRRQTLPFRSPRSHFGLVLTSAVGPRLWHRRSPGALCVVPGWALASRPFPQPVPAAPRGQLPR